MFITALVLITFIYLVGDQIYKMASMARLLKNRLREGGSGRGGDDERVFHRGPYRDIDTSAIISPQLRGRGSSLGGSFHRDARRMSVRETDPVIDEVSRGGQ